MGTPNDPEAVRRARVRQLWLTRPPQERAAETGTLNFFQWLKDHYPQLLPPGQGDPYQRLRAQLIDDDHEGSEGTETK